jgi:uncharacterized membrane protein (DUF2068 family)
VWRDVTTRAHDAPRAFRAIVAYKLVRAVAAMGLAALLAALALAGLGPSLRAIAARIHAHAASAWSIEIANLLVSAARRGHLWILVLALASDGAYSAFEGWALHRRFPWAPWIVVAATTLFVPFEIAALVAQVNAGRVLLLAANVTIALYLAHRAIVERRARAA